VASSHYPSSTESSEKMGDVKIQSEKVRDVKIQRTEESAVMGK
jgi:hypothetical protein